MFDYTGRCAAAGEHDPRQQDGVRPVRASLHWRVAAAQGGGRVHERTVHDRVRQERMRRKREWKRIARAGVDGEARV